MTRKEEISQAAENFLDKNKNIYFYADAFEGGAKWADENPILKVKEVDLKKEFYDFLDTLIGKDNGHLSEDELFRIAEYFFELGLKVQKGE